MTDLPARRQYNETEAGLILRRAAELQAGAAAGTGMSLVELEGVAKEAGIDPSLVRRAAADLRAGVGETSGGGLIGAPLAQVFEHSVAREVTSDDHDELLLEVRRHLGEPDRVDVRGHSLTVHVGKGRKISISVVPRAGRTLVRVDEDTSALAGGLLGGLGGGLAGGGVALVILLFVSVLQVPALVVPGLLLWFFAAFMVARAVYRGIVGQRRAQLGRLAEGLADVAGAKLGDAEPRD